MAIQEEATDQEDLQEVVEFSRSLELKEMSLMAATKANLVIEERELEVAEDRELTLIEVVVDTVTRRDKCRILDTAEE